MQRFAERLNRSRLLGRMISFLSVRLAHYRGLPILLGVIFAVVSWLLHLIAYMTDSGAWQVIAFTVLHLALISGFLGILLAEPLGKG